MASKARGSERVEEKENVMIIDCDEVQAACQQEVSKSRSEQTRSVQRFMDSADAFDDDDDFRPSRPKGAAMKSKKKPRTDGRF